MAMQGHARTLEQYADLEENHIELLARHNKIREGYEELKKVGRDKERQQLKGKIKMRQTLLREAAEAAPSTPKRGRRSFCCC
ncbi:hypothetical protein QQ045_029306 [Rhodiola kirilowii]